MALREHEATPATEDEPVDDSPHTVVTVAEPAPPPPPSYPWDKALGWVDRQQVRIPPVAFGGAVLKKAGEDQVTLLAAVMSHFGMLSMFPLLLLLVTLAGYVFHDDDAAQQAIIDAAIENFPVLGDYLRASVQALPGIGRGAAVRLRPPALGLARLHQDGPGRHGRRLGRAAPAPSRLLAAARSLRLGPRDAGPADGAHRHRHGRVA